MHWKLRTLTLSIRNRRIGKNALNCYLQLFSVSLSDSLWSGIFIPRSEKIIVTRTIPQSYQHFNGNFSIGQNQGICFRHEYISWYSNGFSLHQCEMKKYLKSISYPFVRYKWFGRELYWSVHPQSWRPLQRNECRESHSLPGTGQSGAARPLRHSPWDCSCLIVTDVYWYWATHRSCWLAGLGVSGVLGSGVPHEPAEDWPRGDTEKGSWCELCRLGGRRGTRSWPLASLSTLYTCNTGHWGLFVNTRDDPQIQKLLNFT